jgi:hypothetical protein
LWKKTEMSTINFWMIKVILSHRIQGHFKKKKDT